MTVRNLDALFNPRSIALIGAGGEAEDLLAHNLMQGGFQGPVIPVDATRHALHGAITCKNIAELPLTPDLAVITSPLPQVPALLTQLGERGTKAAILISTNRTLSDIEDPRTLYEALQAAARPHPVRLLGPGSVGLMVPALGLNASLSRYSPQPGSVALITQSNAIAQAFLDRNAALGIGFSHLIGIGAGLDVDFTSVLNYLANDYRVRAILLYVESIRQPREFMSAARRAARTKPVMVLKPTHASPREATDAEADDAVYDAAFRRAGLLRVSDREQLFSLVEALTAAKPVTHDRLAIISNSRSISLLATEVLYRLNGRLAQFSEHTQRGLEALIPSVEAAFNPTDLGASARTERYAKALDLVLQDRGVDGILVICAPSAFGDPMGVAHLLVDRLAKARCALLASFVGPNAGAAARRFTADHGIPTYESAEHAVNVFMRLVQYKRNRQLLMETPPSVPEQFTPLRENAHHLINTALKEHRRRLNEAETLRLLAAYGIPVVHTEIAATPTEAAAIAQRLGQPVVLKILSPDIADKVSIGAVRYDLISPPEVLEAAEKLLIHIQHVAPTARCHGFIVQPMEYPHASCEITLGMRPGGPFGPVMYFGHGGPHAPMIGDIAYGLPPLNMHLAREMMAQTRLYPALRYRVMRRVDLEAIALTLVKISQIVVDFPEVSRLSINPLRADERGVLALDAHIDIAPAAPATTPRLAIHPYPVELEERLHLPDGRTLLLRPILPEDETALHDLVSRLSTYDLRLRFFQPIRELPHDMAARLTQIDYAYDMTFVAVGPGQPGKAPLYGMVNMNADVDRDKAEYGLLVDSNYRDAELGSLLVRRIIHYARCQGIRTLYGEVLRENEIMLKICRNLGFQLHSEADDPTIVQVTLHL